jgi:phosphohistidine swiveling domain-containing protein
MNASGNDNLYCIEAGNVACTRTIGAKARSLQQLKALGLPVPAGYILASGFFQPWFDLIQRFPSWDARRTGNRERWPALCAEIRADAADLPFSDLQLQTMAALCGRLAVHGPAQRFAVRSSSPDEDAAGASFAGLYETELGILAAGMEAAIRRCFAACLDYRVFAYKSAHDMDMKPSLALIVQVQIDSDVAGVGFSLNPLTNDFDESAIDANWGLGESVVTGMVTPDHFVVDKLSGGVVERRLGAKQTSVMLAPMSGTTAARDPRHSEYCLTEAQLRELNATICRIEKLYGHPVDIEWAYAHGQLFILQARPITSYVPLPAEMQTAPGVRRVLYMDIALSKGMTTNAPISPIGLDWLAGDIECMLKHCTGRVAPNLKSPHGLLFLGGGRMYMNLSNLLCFMNPAQLAKGSAATDQLMADILVGIDVVRYRSANRPAWIWPALRGVPRALWRLRRAIWRALRCVLAPASTHRLYQDDKQRFEAEYATLADDSLPLDEFQRRYGAPVIAAVIDADMPALGVGVLAVNVVRALASKRSAEELALVEQLSKGIRGNVVVDMGICIFEMAKMLEAEAFDDLDALYARIRQREMASDFLETWDRFMLTYGCRGPGEMDLANKHYADEPMMVLRQMSFMANSTGQFDPAHSHHLLAQRRRQAYQELLHRFGWLRRALLRRANTLIDLFGGERDTPKQHNLMYQHAARKRLLVEGARLVAVDRLDRPDQVFDLTLTDLLAADDAPERNLRELGWQRTRFGEQLKTHVRTFPPVIDSRGRIQRAPRRTEQPGQVCGVGVSPGVVSGRVKLMHNAHDKSVEKGEVLVAFTTDPGWTPLFINAAAVVLEVGGVLQHGAVVAREYGKPCVAGIADVLNRFSEGQMVEVDGTGGVVRIISTPSAT